MTYRIPNINSPLVDENGKITPPWNTFFQQFNQSAPASQTVSVGNSPFSYTPNTPGNVYVSGGTVSNISLIRGNVVINLTGQPIVPISIGDTVKITYSSVPTVKFLGN